jgi:hypothetical protein
VVKSIVSLVVALSLGLLVGSASAGQPATTDFDACNREALSNVKEGGVDKPSASPRMQGLPSPSTPGAAPGTPSTSAGNPGAGSAASADPQLQGMSVGKDPAYQVAYRECMKRRGF